MLVPISTEMEDSRPEARLKVFIRDILLLH